MKIKFIAPAKVGVLRFLTPYREFECNLAGKLFCSCSSYTEFSRQISLKFSI
jgi:hypothetical protein